MAVNPDKLELLGLILTLVGDTLSVIASIEEAAIKQADGDKGDGGSDSTTAADTKAEELEITGGWVTVAGDILALLAFLEEQEAPAQ